jgi:DNA repair protein RadC
MSSPFRYLEATGQYKVLRPLTANEILVKAKSIIKRQFQRGKAISSPDECREFLMLELSSLEHELFYCIFLDNQHRIIKSECCFKGTIHHANVYPRELLKRALKLNAKALILAHNHPSGQSEPSKEDKAITKSLIDALALVEITVLDHFVIGGTELFSFAEAGLL